MKRFIVVLLILALVLTGCQMLDQDHEPAPIAQHVWKYRSKFVYENPALSPSEKVGMIYAVGAVLEIDPDALEAELEANGLGNADDGIPEDADED